jgi:hypothetical protein
MSNSWQAPVNSEPSVGTLHLLEESARNSSYDLSDSSVGDSYELCDLSSKVPVGTKAIIGFIQIESIGGDERTILRVRNYGSSETDSVRVRIARLHAERNATGGSIVLGMPIIIKATTGKWEYRREDATYSIATLDFVLWGYYL